MSKIRDLELKKIRLSDEGDENALIDLDYEINNLRETINQQRVSYYSTLKEQETDISQAICAFVTFRSFEGRERALKEFNVPWYIRWTYFFSQFCLNEKYKEKRLQGRFLYVKDTLEPELLNWHNFGRRGFSFVFRNIVYYAAILLFLLFSFYICKSVNNESIEYKMRVPDIDCKGQFTE